MSIRIKTSRFSFVQFAESDTVQQCSATDIGLCLPVFDKDDIAFQFVIETDEVEEADALCDRANTSVILGLKLVCADPFFSTFSQKPERFRISERQVLYNWNQGFDGFENIIIGDCFYIGVQVTLSTYPIEIANFCSNCFTKISGDCHTSVLEYGNDEDAFNFNYCNSAVTDDDAGTDCSPTFISFTNVPTLVIPYTASMAVKYGTLPTVQSWLVAPDGSLQDMGIQVKFNTYPPTQILFDFGGNASGVIRIS